MQQEDGGPNFTLARNFPRIVRWKGKKDGGQEGRKNVNADQKGESEAAPQVEAAEELGDEVEHGEGGLGRFPTGAVAGDMHKTVFANARECQIPSIKPTMSKKKSRPKLDGAIASNSSSSIRWNMGV